MSKHPDFSSVPDCSINELLRLAEKCLEGTIQLALAADQRATTMAGIFGAGSVALLAISATVLAGVTPDKPFINAAIAAAIVLFFAALLCAWAARPVDFYIAGYEPQKLAKSASEPLLMKRFTAEDMQMRIDNNRDVLDRASAMLRMGTALAFIAPIFAIGIYAVFYGG